MRIQQRLCFSTLWAASIVAAVSFTGCGDAPPPVKESAPPAEAHAHPTEGPHHGDLVELGAEEYHAEVVHGEGGEVTVYVLDSAAAKAVPIAAAEITINLTHDGEAEQFTLAASPEEGDPEGKASRFFLKDEDLAHDLDHDGAAAKIVVNIDGKQFTGKINHEHGHADHEH